MLTNLQKKLLSTQVHSHFFRATKEKILKMGFVTTRNKRYFFIERAREWGQYIKAHSGNAKH